MNPSIFTFDQLTNVFTTNTDNVDFEAVENLQITAWIGNGLTIYDAQKTSHPFDMNLVDWCKTSPVLAANPVVISQDYTYQDNVVAQFEINPYTSDMVFSECPLVVSCATVTSVDGLDFCSISDSLTTAQWQDHDVSGIPRVTYNFESDDNVNLGTQLVEIEITAT